MERLDRENTYTDIKFSTTRSLTRLSFSLSFSLSTLWYYQKDGVLDIMCHVKSSYAFRTVKLLFIPRARGAKREEKMRMRKRRARMKNGEEAGASRRNHLATSNPLRTKLRSYHRASCQDASTIYKCKRMRECFWFNDASFCPSRKEKERKAK